MLDASKLPKQLVELNIRENQITAIPDMSDFKEMTKLELNDNKIRNVGKMPPQVENLDFSG